MYYRIKSQKLDIVIIKHIVGGHLGTWWQLKHVYLLFRLQNIKKVHYLIFLYLAVSDLPIVDKIWDNLYSDIYLHQIKDLQQNNDMRTNTIIKTFFQISITTQRI